MKENFNFKGLIDNIINRFLDIMNIRPFKPNVDNFLRQQYNASMEQVENEIKPSVNFVPSNKNIDFLSDYAFGNVQAGADEIGQQLRQEIQRGIMSKETPAQLKKRVKDVFKDKKFSNRLKTIMRTEKLRANNMGAYDGALQAEEAGIKLLKYLDVTQDARTSDICHAEHRKYGTKEEAIPLDQEFEVTVDNKTIRAQYPPFHINCRTVIKFVRVE